MFQKETFISDEQDSVHMTVDSVDVDQQLDLCFLFSFRISVYNPTVATHWLTPDDILNL